MASPGAIAVKSASAVIKIQKASAALAEKFGIEYEPLTAMAKVDPAFARAAELEHIGNFLHQVAVASKSAKDADFVEAFEQSDAPAVPPEAVEEAAEVVTEEKTNAAGKPKGKSGKGTGKGK